MFVSKGDNCVLPPRKFTDSYKIKVKKFELNPLDPGL